MPRPRRESRRQGGGGQRIIQRFLDPDNDHPILRNLIKTLGPILLTFLTTQLPTWLSGIDLAALDDDEPTPD